MLALILRCALRNPLRHRLRTTLTVAGIVVAILAFGLLRTVVSAWYAGADAASDKRLITRNAISLAFSMPLAYAERIRGVEGVTGVSWANWFGGIYIDARNFFPQSAVDAETYFSLYPEFVLPEEQLTAFRRDRRGAVAGAKLAARYGWKVGDVIPIKGTIYPGNYEFVLRGIYHGARSSTDENQFLFQWEFLNERIKQLSMARVNQIGVFLVGIDEPSHAAAVSKRIDETFRNSLAETLTETEKAFQLSFVAMTGTIVNAIQLVSYVIILIIMAVMANTMAMSARERTREYATLKALGFRGWVVASLIYAESMAIALVAGGIGIAATGPAARFVGSKLDAIFPIFNVSPGTIQQQWAAALVIGITSALIPARRAVRVKIIDGLRQVL
ncbi:ABC transporter permease [Uliginosibacterium sp. sgz301328]|uniref:ABC transporter permease n=1 Tax=Uliginosibacterium sp. sgz301328 TaxID=3243764 RepID=UPI00359E3B4E